jgi:hypothetical protein
MQPDFFLYDFKAGQAQCPYTFGVKGCALLN